MAKKSGEAGEKVNRSQLIREYLALHPEEGPKAIREGLKNQGYTVTPALINRVKYGTGTSGKKRRKKRSGRPPMARAAAASAPARASESDMLSLDSLVQAKKLAEALGGVANARAALAALAKLQ